MSPRPRFPSATVTSKNQTTGQKRTPKADEKGFYSPSNLPPGRYDAASVHAGFGDLGKKNLPVDVGQEIVVDFQLEIGMIGSSVDVSAKTRGGSLASPP
jgi:hypothetical protein